jgi:putative metalloprotease
MKKIITLALLLCAVGANAQFKLNTGKLLNAAANAAQAYTLTDADVAALCADAVAWEDANNAVPPADNPYTVRLNKLTKGITEVNGRPVNFKVYDVTDVNAHAWGDGSIRVFSSLMDLMDDDQLMAIIGHEIGHVANGDAKDAMKQAYKVEAGKNLIASTGDKMAKLTDSQLGGLAGAYANSKFSREQEFEADDYGMKVCIEQGYSALGMARALEKLVELSESGGEQASLLQNMFSSHPDSALRAQRMREKAAAIEAAK